MQEPRPLTERTIFLLSQLGFHVAEEFTRRLEPLGLTTRQFGLLVNIHGADGPSQQQLADGLGLHRNVMVGMVDDLEGRGLVRRTRHARDRRAHAIVLTRSARSLLAEAERVADDYEAELLDGVPAEQRRTLLELLWRVAANTDLTPAVHPFLGRSVESLEGPGI